MVCTGSSWDFGAHNARLYKEDDANMKRVGAWCASKLKNQWLQVDLGKVKTVTAVATQGLCLVVLRPVSTSANLVARTGTIACSSIEKK